jgi:hypothetical protein
VISCSTIAPLELTGLVSLRKVFPLLNTTSSNPRFAGFV